MMRATGYTVEELMRIENVFEMSRKYAQYASEEQYNSLCAVIDVLTDIHGIEAPKNQLNDVARTKGVTNLQPA
ncbi:hypothetical protein LEM8419_03497 [Neolewinella maritima]|uniref:Uncharacterized protein n=1 Tax=Neolewinella maritima TaxID=1383882 RepID=A0ABN8FF40_9BACT|nr:hypothetical protein [Neolewinella maritima]CAH1002625.1 hypothetical protein LEM8419_03497 [Neolewinella maritima]